MTVEELRQWRDEQRPHLLIDVREPGEHAANRIEGAQLIPLRELQSNVKRLPEGSADRRALPVWRPQCGRCGAAEGPGL